MSETTGTTALDPLSGLDLSLVGHELTKAGITHGQLSATVLTGGRSNITYKVTDDHRTWVVRRPPLSGLTQSAHDVGREFRIMKALQNTGVPTPPVVSEVDVPNPMDAPFTIVDFVPGVTYRTQHDLEALDDTGIKKCHNELIRVLVKLHDIAPESVGIGEFGRTAGFAERQVRRWRKQWDSVQSHEFEGVEQLFQLLLARVPSRAHETIVHGDYRVDNLLFAPDDPGRALAVVDWEMATLGDPITDVAMMCAYQHPAFDHVAGEPAASTSPRWPAPRTIVEDYLNASGRDVDDIDFYLGLAHFKLAVIAQGIYARYLQGSGTGPGFATAGASVPGLIEKGLEIVG